MQVSEFHIPEHGGTQLSWKMLKAASPCPQPEGGPCLPCPGLSDTQLSVGVRKIRLGSHKPQI